MGAFIGWFSSNFGYILNFIYDLVHNYGLAIIIFSVLLKIALLPLSINQQKTMRKTARIQPKMKEIQNKYKNDPEKMNREVMDLYKKENMSPFSGCLSGIVQIILLFSIFFLVRNPLTHMKHIDATDIEGYQNIIKQEAEGWEPSAQYPEISIIKYVQEKNLEDSNEYVNEENDLKERDFYINMDFLGLDLSNVPQENYQEWTVYIIPVLYVLSSMLSIRIVNNMNTKNKKKEDIIEINDGKKVPEEPDMAEQMNKSMTWMMPIMSISISIFAPLGLALYWLINNVLMIAERLILNKVLSSKEEEQNV